MAFVHRRTGLRSASRSWGRTGLQQQVAEVRQLELDQMEQLAFLARCGLLRAAGSRAQRTLASGGNPGERDDSRRRVILLLVSVHERATPACVSSGWGDRERDGATCG